VELGARHSYREAARLLETLLPCGPVNHATMRNRTHRVAADLESAVTALAKPNPDRDPSTEIMMVIDGAHIRAAHGYQARHIDVTVGKIEVAGKSPRRFALAPKGAEAPLATLREALREQGWRTGRTVTVLCDGEPALPVWSVPPSASPSPAFWIGGTSPCGFGILSKRCEGFMPLNRCTGQEWKSPSGGLDACGT
jgi:hypothetical protein